MVLQAIIYRASDGLPLSASTDIDQRPEIRECQRFLKMISKRLHSLPDRCSLHLSGYHIHVITAIGVGFTMLCEESYSQLLSFCFLDEIQREFIVTYSTQRVQAAKRPYAFIEFDMFLQKTKQRYNNPRSLSTRMNLADMSMEVKLRPPQILDERDLAYNPASNGQIFTPHNDTHRPLVSSRNRLQPLGWVGWLASLINLFCAALNFIRGMTVISHGHFDVVEDAGAYWHGAIFILTALLYIYQVYLLCYGVKWRHLQNTCALLLICYCCYELEEFRNIIQIAFHLSVAFFTSVVITSRRRTEKLPGYSV